MKKLEFPLSSHYVRDHTNGHQVIQTRSVFLILS